MVRARGKRVNRAEAGPSRPRKKLADSGALPDVYQDLLRDVIPSSSTNLSEEGTAVKKRRVAGHIVTSKQEPRDQKSVLRDPSVAPSETSTTGFHPNENLSISSKVQQTAFDDSAESSDSDSDIPWEEVDVGNGNPGHSSFDDEREDDKELNLVLNGDQGFMPKYQRRKQRALTTADRKQRLDVHKMHILCLLHHVHLRNRWCNDAKIQAIMRKKMTKETISYLNPGESLSQFQRSHSFMDGLDKASRAFRVAYRITARGMARPHWASNLEDLKKMNIPHDLDLPIELPDFHEIAKQMQASRDIGAQLFCAMLRSVGVEARLVCSLQPLPFGASAIRATPKRQKYTYAAVYADSADSDSPLDSVNASSKTTTPAASAIEHARNPRSRLGARITRAPLLPSADVVAKTLASKKPTKKPIHESPYPIFWVEVFNAAVQKWIPVDPLVTMTVAKASKFEPPASDSENSMTYVIAFEDDESAKDVTRRYAKAYNAKTRRSRVETTDGGKIWWHRVMRKYKKIFQFDRDQVEDAELQAREAAEAMPKNVQDFKNHPYYALERHLRRNEVIYPKREAGKVQLGKTLEPIYRRQDVQFVKSADGWYRIGREIKLGEQPLKRVPARQRQQSYDAEDLGDEQDTGTGMYSISQTNIYKAPPVVNGRIPKNAYGNLDVYVPSMVPSGGIHITSPDASRAAKLLGIDFADAVTGFEFKGRHGTAIVKGAVVAAEYEEAIMEIIKGFTDEKARVEEERRSREAIRMWKMFLAGLRIKKRIDGYNIEGETEIMNDMDDDMSDDDTGNNEEEDYEMAGGFMPNADQETTAEPMAGWKTDLRMEYHGRTYGDEQFPSGGEHLSRFRRDPSSVVADSHGSIEHSGGGVSEYLGYFETGKLIGGLGSMGYDDDGGGGFLAEEVAGSVELSENDVEGGGGFVRNENFDEKTPRRGIFSSLNREIEDPAGVDREEEGAIPDAISSREVEFGRNVDKVSVFAGGHVFDSVGSKDLPELESAQLNQKAERQDEIFDGGRHQNEKLNKEEQVAGRAITNGVLTEESTSMRNTDTTTIFEGNPPSDLVMEDDEDKESLLSHDPEEEDAYPDWLT